MDDIAVADRQPEPDALRAPHAASAEEVLGALGTSPHGLSSGEAASRLERYGPNTLPHAEAPGFPVIFLRQFLSPLIYVLVIAAVISMALGEWADAGFIWAVLLINALIGAVQEHSAEKAAVALQKLVSEVVAVVREGEAYEIDARALVPGDIVLLEPGYKIPADLRLIAESGLQADESLLTGESLLVSKQTRTPVEREAVIGDRTNMAFAGTLVARGHGRGVVVATGLASELGRIAEAVLEKRQTKPPLLIRMERFTRRVAYFILGAVAVMAVVSAMHGMPLAEVFFLSVALAVSAIPEGLPVALTVALAIGMRRMARRSVIIRKLVAVEALGSCTFIASDKTGTLTVNELTARRLVFAHEPAWEVTGEGTVPEGNILTPHGTPTEREAGLVHRLCTAVALANEGFLGHRDSGWVHHGDPLDVALLVMAHKAGVTLPEALAAHPQLAALPFESERRFAANLNRVDDGAGCAFVKGALERLLPMCAHMATTAGDRVLDAEHVSAQAQVLAREGYRVLAVAAGRVACEDPERFSEEALDDLVLLGLVGMIDPLRPEAKAAVAACRDAGIEVAMVTGDHPATALAIGRELGMTGADAPAITGTELAAAEDEGPQALDGLTREVRVFARVAPQQKLSIVNSLQRQNHFVAVTGDGANDAPALRSAHVGVAMGRKGTDVARETADLIITDDNFASIVAGVEEGRVAYANVRKVIFLLISTGAAEIVLFILALIAGLPLPLVAVQLLWLNLVTNGIQDVALAFEPAEGDELRRPPRPPREPIFNRLMLERVVLSGLVIGVSAFVVFQWLLTHGFAEAQARNLTLLLMVLFENVHVFNSRSETRSAFTHSPWRNPLLLFGTLAAQAVHIAAMFTPGLREVLGVEPVAIESWGTLLGVALVVLLVMEGHKALWRWAAARRASTGLHRATR
jgi:Ca2+-transporting ATPase